MGFNSHFTPAPDVKVKINIGCMFDIPTGRFVRGYYGESLLNAGLAQLTGFIGPGNMFKSTQMHWQVLTAMSRVPGSEGGTYDTEVTVENERMADFGHAIEDFNGEDVIGTSRWQVTDSRMHSGNKWFEQEKKALEEKEKDKKQLMRTPYMDYGRTTQFSMLRPTFREIDSLSEWSTDAMNAIYEDNEVGDSKGNMVFMKGGNDKTKLIQQLPALCGRSNHYMLMSAHLGKAFNMDPHAPVRKQLQHIPMDYKIKGVPEKFTFQMNNAWLCFSATVMAMDKVKTVEYPRSTDDDMKGDTDLNIIWVIQTRGKSGPTGMPIGVIVSQQEGVLPTLSEFHYLKTTERFGIEGVGTEGNVQNYFMSLYPAAKLSRTAVRRKIDSDRRLRMAIHYSSEICQMKELWHDNRTAALMCTMKELYEDLKAKGYDWDVLLDQRPWVGLDLDYKYDREYLSSHCLLRMRLPHTHVDHYHPYWMTPLDAEGKVVNNNIIAYELPPKAPKKVAVVA